VLPLRGRPRFIGNIYKEIAHKLHTTEATPDKMFAATM